MVLNNRRLAWVEVGLAMPLIYFLIGAGPLRSRINRWMVVFVPVVILYIVAGSKIDSPLFAPAHAFATTGSNYDASSLARQEEDRNLLHTLVDIGNPIVGTGWGRPYDKVTSVLCQTMHAAWILAPYTPHNSLLGLAAYSGLVGLIGIWGVVPMGAYLAARGYRGSTELVPRAGGMIALCALADLQRAVLRRHRLGVLRRRIDVRCGSCDGGQGCSMERSGAIGADSDNASRR